MANTHPLRCYEDDDDDDDYMAQSHKDWKLPNAQILLAEINIVF